MIFLCGFAVQAQELVSGQTTLTKIKEGVYEIQKEDEAAIKIDLRPNVEAHLQGKLAVLFNDCEPLRLSVFELKNITESDLIRSVEKYNQCDRSPFEPTEKEVEKAAKFQSDTYVLFAGVVGSLNRIGFFEKSKYENLLQGQFSFGIAASPGFMGSLQGNLYLTAEVSAAFSGDKDFDNSELPINYKKNSFRGILGTEFHFNKNGTIKPLAGIGVGLVRDHYNGQYDVFKLKQNEGSAFVVPKVGVLFALDNKKSLGIILNYIPEYKDDLSFIGDGEEVSLIVNTHYFNAGLYLYF